MQTSASSFSFTNGVTYITTAAKNHSVAIASSVALAAGLYYYCVHKPKMVAMQECDKKLLAAIKSAVEVNDFIIPVFEASTLDAAIGSMRSLSTTNRTLLVQLAKTYDDGLMEGYDMAETRTQLLKLINTLLQ